MKRWLTGSKRERKAASTPHASLGNGGIKVLTANEGRPGGLEGEVEDALAQPPVIEDFGHVGRYPVATAPIFLDRGQGGEGGGKERN